MKKVLCILYFVAISLVSFCQNNLAEVPAPVDDIQYKSAQVNQNYLIKNGDTLRTEEANYFATASGDVYTFPQLKSLGYSDGEITDGIIKKKLDMLIISEVYGRQRWVYSCSTSSDKWYVSSEYMQKGSNIVCWTKVKSDTMTMHKKLYKNSEQKILIEIDVKLNKYRLMQTTTYDERDNVIDNNDTPDDFFQWAIPESALFEVIRTAKNMVDYYTGRR